MLEGEIAFINELEQLMNIVEDFTRSITNHMLQSHHETISVLQSGTTRYVVVVCGLYFVESYFS